ncbi:hypothetical protein H4218_006021, partial [Coemansia sp. IMI 209128]
MIKISNIELTPESCVYDSKDWQVETMANERIIAIGIYYYDMENIAESRIQFREKIDKHIERVQNDWVGAYQAYGY